MGTGERVWFAPLESIYGDADPLIVRDWAVVSAVKECAVVALDLKSGREVWQADTPDCTSYSIVED